MTQSVYEAAGGAEAMLRLARAWHQRCLADPVAAHPFEHAGHPQHTERLAAYWGEALGGPPTYTQTMGDETRVQRMHAGNGEHRELDERAVACFVAALDDAAIPDDETLRSTLVAYFRWGVEQLSQHPDTHQTVPKGLPLPHWGWDGPVTA